MGIGYNQEGAGFTFWVGHLLSFHGGSEFCREYDFSGLHAPRSLGTRLALEFERTRAFVADASAI